MTEQTKSRLRLALRIAFAAIVLVACAWFVRGLPRHALGAALASASIPWVAAAAALNLLQVVFRSALVGVLLLPVARVPLFRLVGYNLTTFAANNLLPGRAGEVVRVYLLNSREGVPAASSIALSLVEKVFEVIALLCLVAPLPLLLPGLPRSVSIAIELLGAGGLLAIVIVWAIARFVRGDADRWFSRFAAGAHVLRRPRLAALSLLLSLSVWAADAGEVWLVLRSLRIEVAPAAPLLILLVLNLAIALPSTPAQLGPFEAAAAGALALLGVARAPALAFAIIYHGMQIIPVTLLGAPGLRMVRLTREKAPPGAL